MIVRPPSGAKTHFPNRQCQILPLSQSETQSKAAWLVEHRKPLQVKAASYIKPRDDELVIRNHAVAVNPVSTLR